MKAYAGKDNKTYFEICPYCLENETRSKDEACDKCAKAFCEEEDRKDHINRCDW